MARECVCVCAHMDRAISLSRILVAICYPLPFWVCVWMCVCSFLWVFCSCSSGLCTSSHMLCLHLFSSTTEESVGGHDKIWETFLLLAAQMCSVEDQSLANPLPGQCLRTGVNTHTVCTLFESDHGLMKTPQIPHALSLSLIKFSVTGIWLSQASLSWC